MLSYGGRYLSDDKTIEDYNIQREATLNLDMRLHGGARTRRDATGNKINSKHINKGKHSQKAASKKRSLRCTPIRTRTQQNESGDFNNMPSLKDRSDSNTSSEEESSDTDEELLEEESSSEHTYARVITRQMLRNLQHPSTDHPRVTPNAPPQSPEECTKESTQANSPEEATAPEVTIDTDDDTDVQSEEEFEVEGILGERGDENNKEYLIKWKWFPPSWEPANNVIGNVHLETWKAAKSSFTSSRSAKQKPSRKSKKAQQQQERIRQKRAADLLKEMEELENAPFNYNESILPTLLGKDPQINVNLANVPSNFEECKQSLLPLILRLHMAAEGLNSLPPASRWCTALKNDWSEALLTFTPQLEAAIFQYEQYNDEAALLRAVLDYIALPSQVLLTYTNIKQKTGRFTMEIPHLNDVNTFERYTLYIGDEDASLDEASQPPPSPPPSNPSPPIAIAVGEDDRIFKQMKHHVKQGDARSAQKAMQSHGRAASNNRTADVMSKMHPDYGREAPCEVQNTGKHIQLDREDCNRAVKNNALKENKAADAFGWKTNWLSLVTGDKQVTRTFAKLYQLVAKANLPEAVNFILTTGKLIALNKVPSAENEERLKQNKDPLARPVNVPGDLINKAFSRALNSKSGRRAKLSVGPEQKFADKHGLLKSTQQVAAAYKEGKIIQTTDFKNAFNAANRQELLDSLVDIWPEAADMLRSYYATESLVLYPYWENGQRVIRVIWSKEGCKMGCPLGTLAFVAAQHAHIVKGFQEQYPEDVVELLAIVDDITKCWTTSVSTPEEVEALGQRIFAAQELMKKLSSQIHLELVPEKCKVLVPPDFPADLSSGVWKDLNATRDGITVNGTPMGTDDHVRDVCRDKLDRAILFIGKVGDLGELDPQMASRVLRLSCNFAFDFTVQSIHHDIIKDIIHEFDSAIIAQQLALVTVNTHVAPIDDIGLQSVQQSLLETDLLNGGFGLTPLELRAPSRFWGTVATMAKDRILGPKRPLFEDEINRTAQALKTLTGKNPEDTAYLSNWVPDEPYEAITTDFTKHLNTSKSVSGNLVKLLLKVRRERLIVQLAVHPEELGMSGNKYISDRVRFLSILLRSQVSRVLNVDLRDQHMRVDATSFRNFFSCLLGLQPTHKLGPYDLISQKVETESQRCTFGHKEESVHHFDRHGDHAAACPSGGVNRKSTHDNMNKSIHALFSEAGLTSKFEPSSTKVLGHSLTKDQCKNYFMKLTGFTKKERALHAEYCKLTKQLLVGKGPDGKKFSKAELQETQQVLQSVKACLPDIPDELYDTKGHDLRVDLQVVKPGSGTVDILTDVTCIHPSLPGQQGVQLATALHAYQQIVQNNDVGKDGESTPSPAVTKAINKKLNMYRPLVELADLLHSRGVRKHKATFLPLVVTHWGELSSGWFVLARYLHDFVKHSPRYKRQLDGTLPSKAAGIWRKQLMDRVMVMLVRGWGKHLHEVGYCLADGRLAV